MRVFLYGSTRVISSCFNITRAGFPQLTPSDPRSGRVEADAPPATIFAKVFLGSLLWPSDGGLIGHEAAMKASANPRKDVES